MLRSILRVAVLVALVSLGSASLGAEKRDRAAPDADWQGAIADWVRVLHTLFVGPEFARVFPPRPAPVLTLLARDGNEHGIAEFRGRFVLVNLWATWCVPCVRELPSLDRAQQQFGERLPIVAISQDKGGGAVVWPFLAKRAPLRLTVFLDPANAASHGFGAHAFPTSLLVDRDGRVVASLVGAVEWDSPSVMAELERYLAADRRPVH